MSKVIVHIDLNAFFVRCEEIKNPSLENKPVAVGHEGRSGIVSTCSYEARKYGVHSGMPMFQATKACPSLIIIPPDFRFYEVKSKEFMNYVKSFTKVVEKASIDECYADFSEVLKDVKDVKAFFAGLQKGLYEKTQLKCSIGVGPTKFLAKMGSDYQKPMGLTIIRRRDVPTILYPLSLDKMYGIGKKTLPRLEAMGIKTIGDLAKRCEEDDPQLIDTLGKFFYVIKDWTHGYGSDEIDVEPFDPKSIGNSTTLRFDSNSYDEISSVIKGLSEEVSSRAIKEDKLGTTVQLVIKDTAFQSHSKSVTFSTPTNSASVIYEKALKLYENNFLDKTIRLVGVTLQNLVSKKDIVVQMTLFDYEKHEEESQTKLLIDELNRKLKKPLLKRASEVDKDEN